MNVFQHRPTLRWTVPLVVAAVLGAGGSAVGVIAATARDGLPHRSAPQLLVDVQKARLDGLSGTIVENADLGLPSLPGTASGGGGSGSGSSDMTSLVSGSHTMRLWYAGPNRMRVSLLGTLGESDVVRNGKDLWIWSSAKKSAVHRTVPTTGADRPDSLAAMSPMTPQRAADAALAALTPTTKVSVDGTAVVAGRSAYELLLRPRDSRSLVESVRIAVDAKTHVPTRVQVFADNASKPAIEVGFTSFDPSQPAASVFAFRVPPHTKVTQAGRPEIPGSPKVGAEQHQAHPRTGRRPGGEPRIVGKGWTSVVVAQVPPGATAGAGSLSRMLAVLPKVSGAWGSGVLLRSALFSAVLTHDGRVAVGAVRPGELYRALGRR